LKGKGYYLGAIDGQWGPESISALQRFQTARGIDNEGKITALALIGLGLGPKYNHVITLPVADDSIADRADDPVD
jgi:peptidoglycan hydrolase-like protein with peptidoglycan-binding domain